MICEDCRLDMEERGHERDCTCPCHDTPTPPTLTDREVWVRVYCAAITRIHRLDAKDAADYAIEKAPKR